MFESGDMGNPCMSLPTVHHLRYRGHAADAIPARLDTNADNTYKYSRYILAKLYLLKAVKGDQQQVTSHYESLAVIGQMAPHGLPNLPRFGWLSLTAVRGLISILWDSIH
jgi:hypothetical protein